MVELLNENLDLPNEFSRFQLFIQEDIKRFYPVFMKYLSTNHTFFQSIVFASDDLANTSNLLEHAKANYSLLAMIGYFLLSQYKKVLTFPIPEDNFEAIYFKIRSARFTGDNALFSALLASSLSILVNLKKTDLATHKAFSTIISLEMASLNSDIKS
ncbi:MAG: hypothetical protein ACTSUR_06140, partial [Candidatus Heimdallarchaeaceae archaeon]